MEARLADRLAALVLDALGRAARVPDGLPLIGARKSPGLFPASALGRQAADQSCHEGWLVKVGPGADSSPLFAITERGLAHLLDEMTPRQVLDDVARAVDARGPQIAQLIATTAALQAELKGVQRLVGSLLPRIESAQARRPEAAFDDLRTILADWHASGDCPLPELFRRSRAKHSNLTIGQFHDQLRRLHDANAIYLHPWTGPLYTLPEPAFALLVGHEVAYYASLKIDQRAPSNHPRSETSERTGPFREPVNV
jgi:hypothetical protein